MQGQLTGTPEAPGTSTTRRTGVRVAVAVALVLLCSFFLPAVPILLGVLLVLAFVLHTVSRDLQPYVESLLRVPVAKASKRHARLSVIGGIGALLIVGGAVGATTRAHLRSELEQRESRREVAGEGVAELLQSAERLLAAGDIEGAELALLDAESIVALDPEMMDEVDELLARVEEVRQSRARR